MPRKVAADEDVCLVGAIPLQVETPRKNAEEFRIIAKRYRGEETVDLRTYYRDRLGTWKPTPRGTLLPRTAVSALKNAVDALSESFAVAKETA